MISFRSIVFSTASGFLGAIYEAINIKWVVNIKPSTVTLKSGGGFFKGQEYKITFTKDGYSATTTKISSSLDGWYK
jgi:hypothetical protein